MKLYWGAEILFLQRKRISFAISVRIEVMTTVLNESNEIFIRNSCDHDIIMQHTHIDVFIYSPKCDIENIFYCSFILSVLAPNTPRIAFETHILQLRENEAHSSLLGGNYFWTFDYDKHNNLKQQLRDVCLGCREERRQ